jgi:hypothetical protein
MEKPLYQQIEELETQIEALKTKVYDFSKSTEEKDIKPYSAVGNKRDRSNIRPADISTGLGQIFSGAIIWNDSEQNQPPYGTKPTNPTKGYNRHSHSRYSGGALDIKTLEIVEYNINWETNGNFQKDCQSLWRGFPPIKTQQNSKNEQVDKIGLLDLVFNADLGKWGVTTSEIDIKKCYLVERDSAGELAKDENGHDKKALLYNADETKTNIIWDKNARCWRFYAVYSEN